MLNLLDYGNKKFNFNICDFYREIKNRHTRSLVFDEEKLEAFFETILNEEVNLHPMQQNTWMRITDETKEMIVFHQ